MKKVLIVGLVFTVILGANCKNYNGKDNSISEKQNVTNGTAELVFREYEHNFGKVSEGEKVAYIFPFENRGPGDLVISNAVTSCGCTASKYDTKPIPQGETGKLEVVFNTSGYNGVQTKTISVRSNAKTPVIILKIIAEVETNHSN
jgi:hypothetical protein